MPNQLADKHVGIAFDPEHGLARGLSSARVQKGNPERVGRGLTAPHDSQSPFLQVAVKQGLQRNSASSLLRQEGKSVEIMRFLDARA